MPTATDLAAEALAAYRLQRLLGVDAITEPLRERAIDATYKHGGIVRADWLAELLACAWCRSVWAAGAVVALRGLPGGRVLRDFLAVAGAAALVAHVLDPPSEEEAPRIGGLALLHGEDGA